LHEVECLEGYRAARTVTHTPPDGEYVPSDEEKSWWATWRHSLEGYPDRETCEEHHDAVSMEAGAIAARFLAWWVPAGMPVGLWEIPFGVEGGGGQ